MKTKNPELLLSTAIFSLVNILYLLFHYSRWGWLSLGLTLGYYFLRFAGAEDKNFTITDAVGSLVGALALNMLLIQMCYAGALSTAALFPRNVGIAIGALAILGVTVFCAVKVNGMLGSFSKHIYPFAALLRYGILIGGTVGCSYLFVAWNKAGLLLPLCCVAAVGLILELVALKNDEDEARRVYLWLVAWFVLFAVGCCLYPDAAVAVIERLRGSMAFERIDWYQAVILLVLFFLGIVESAVLRARGKAWETDTRLYIVLFFGTAFVWITSALPTKYSFLLFMAFVVVALLYLSFDMEDEEIEFLDRSLSRVNLRLAVLLALLLGAPVAYYFGRLLPYAIVALSAAYILIRCSRDSGSKAADKAYRQWGFWQVLLTLLTVYAAVTATMRCRFIGSYLWIGAVYLLTTCALWIIHFNNMRRAINHYAMRLMILAPVILLLLSSAGRSSIRVRYTVDNALSASERIAAEGVRESGAITLTLYAKSEKANIVKAWCYWQENKEAVMELRVGEEQENRIEPRNDCLHLVCEDESGLIFTDKRWFSGEELTEGASVGAPRARVFRRPESDDGQPSTDAPEENAGAENG